MKLVYNKDDNKVAKKQSKLVKNALKLDTMRDFHKKVSPKAIADVAYKLMILNFIFINKLGIKALGLHSVHGAWNKSKPQMGDNPPGWQNIVGAIYRYVRHCEGVEVIEVKKPAKKNKVKAPVSLESKSAKLSKKEKKKEKKARKKAGKEAKRIAKAPKNKIPEKKSRKNDIVVYEAPESDAKYVNKIGEVHSILQNLVDKALQTKSFRVYDGSVGRIGKKSFASSLELSWGWNKAEEQHQWGFKTRVETEEYPVWIWLDDSKQGKKNLKVLKKHFGSDLFSQVNEVELINPISLPGQS